MQVGHIGPPALCLLTFSVPNSRSGVSRVNIRAALWTHAVRRRE